MSSLSSCPKTNPVVPIAPPSSLTSSSFSLSASSLLSELLGLQRGEVRCFASFHQVRRATTWLISLHTLVPHQHKQVFASEIDFFAFHLVLNHFCNLIRDSLIWLLALSNFRYPPLLLESFLRLRLFSPDECMMIGLLWITLEKQQGNWNAATVLGVCE